MATDTIFGDANAQYTDFTINTGITLTVPSGTIIRCTGTFTNSGIVVVQRGASGSQQLGHENAIDSVYVPAEAGVGFAAAGPGEFGDNLGTRSGGLGGLGVSEFQARLIRPAPLQAGGGGGGVFGGPAGAGGGGFTVLAKTGIINNTGAVIIADGGIGAPQPGGGGGGGGGIIVLATPGTVTQAGTITANGGDGAPSGTFAGPGGGGGGGIVHLLAPSIAATGTISVAPGVGGTPGAAKSVSINPLQGGGGGGACGGNGGRGGDVNPPGTPQAPGPASAGYFLQTLADPTSLF